MADTFSLILLNRGVMCACAIGSCSDMVIADIAVRIVTNDLLDDLAALVV
jgi:hypothetical protein